MSRKAMQMALEALEKVITAFGSGLTLQQNAITALRQALEEKPPKREWVGLTGEEALEDGWCDWEFHSPLESLVFSCDCGLIHEVDIRVVRYESLDSEVYEVVDDHNLEAQMRLRRRDDILAELIEQDLKEKNQ